MQILAALWLYLWHGSESQGHRSLSDEIVTFCTLQPSGCVSWVESGPAHTWKAQVQCDIQGTHIDPQLQRIGGSHGHQLPAEQCRLYLPPLLGQQCTAMTLESFGKA